MVGVFITPKYLKPLLVHSKWSFNSASHSSESVIATDLLSLIMYPAISLCSLRLLSRAGINEDGSYVIKSSQIMIFCVLDPLHLLFPLYMFFCLIDSASGSILIANNSGSRQSPCLTPLLRQKMWTYTIDPLSDFGLSYIVFTQSVNVEWTAKAVNVWNTKFHLTRSNAFWASKLSTLVCWDLFLVHNIIFNVLLVLLVPCLPGMMPVWSGLINLVIHCCTLYANTLLRFLGHYTADEQVYILHIGSNHCPLYIKLK